MAKNSLGDISKKGPTNYTGKWAETGTPTSGYSENGPFHCSDCIHRIGGQESDLPFCIHPAVLKDPKLKSKRTLYEKQIAVEIDMKHGCCRFVSQPKEADD